MINRLRLEPPDFLDSALKGATIATIQTRLKSGKSAPSFLFLSSLSLFLTHTHSLFLNFAYTWVLERTSSFLPLAPLNYLSLSLLLYLSVSSSRFFSLSILHTMSHSCSLSL